MSPATRIANGLKDVRTALVVGLGSSGMAAVRLLRAGGVSVSAADASGDEARADQARELGARVVGHVDPALVTDALDVVVPSPGVPETAPVLRAAMARGTPIWSEPELALRRYPHRLVAVTGTNGKTSTTEMITAMLRSAAITAEACGNIGPTVSDVAATVDADTVLVAELSSFQLRFAETLRPEVAVVLNLAEDHLDWHPDFAAYAAAKARIFAAQGPDDWMVTNADDPGTGALATDARGRRAQFSARGPVEVGVGREAGTLHARLPEVTGRLVELGDLAGDPGPGAPAEHHVANVAAAACAALLAGATVPAVAEVAMTVTRGRHRFEVVATDARGVRYVDDSKATNVHAAAAALEGAGDSVWIAGGLAKGADLAALADHLGAVRVAVVIGEAADALAEVCAAARVACRRAGGIEEAVDLASRLAEPGDTVLLAPACASFDQFAGYQERGERFAAAARRAAHGGHEPEGRS